VCFPFFLGHEDDEGPGRECDNAIADSVSSSSSLVLFGERMCDEEPTDGLSVRAAGVTELASMEKLAFDGPAKLPRRPVEELAIEDDRRRLKYDRDGPGFLASKRPSPYSGAPFRNGGPPTK